MTNLTKTNATIMTAANITVGTIFSLFGGGSALKALAVETSKIYGSHVASITAESLDTGKTFLLEKNVKHTVIILNGTPVATDEPLENYTAPRNADGTVDFMAMLML